MFDFNEQEKIDLDKNRNETVDKLLSRYQNGLDISNQLYIELWPSFQKYFEEIQILKLELGFNFFLGLWGEDLSVEGELKLVVQLLNMDTHQRIEVHFILKNDELVPSLCDLWDGAFWSEQECWDMFGIDFSEIPKERILSPEGIKGFPLLKNFAPAPFQLKAAKEYTFSPDTRVSRQEWKKRSVLYKDYFEGQVNGSVRAILECDDETIKRGKLEVGFGHRGIEKIAEGLNVNQFLIHLSRINSNCASSYELAWCMGIENYLNVCIPERARVMRMIFTELDRIYEHLDVIGRIVQSLNCRPYLYDIIEMKKALIKVIQDYSGKKQSHQLIKIGGISKEVPNGWVTNCLGLMSFLGKKSEQLTKLISNSSLWMNRLCDYQLSSKQAISWGVVGPNLRASGVNYDLRKVTPYYFYNDIDFEIPLGINGECYDRYLVRVEEIFQSILIINQLLDNLPLGSFKTEDSRFFVPDKAFVYTEPEALNQHFKLYSQGIDLPKGHFYNSIESPSGELGFSVSSSGGTIPNRVKLKTPSFCSAQSFSDIIEGGSIDEIPLVINSLNLVFGEIDR